MTDGTQQNTPAGWYPDPEKPGQQRYWDGSAWAAPGAPPPPPQSAASTPNASSVPMSATEAKARAKAEKAYAKASRPWYKKKRWWALGIIAVLIVVGVAATNGSDNSKTDGASASSGKSRLTQMQEVTISACSAPDVIGAQYVSGIANNTSSKRSDYFIDVAVIAPDGTQIGTGSTVAQNVEPGQKAVWKALTDVSREDWKEGSTCKVVKVERNASI